VYEYAEPIDEPGFVFMDSPGYDPVAATGQIASGANLICFTTGRGSMFGSKPAPTIKLASNTPMYERLKNDMDINCGAILDGEATCRRWASASSSDPARTPRASRPRASAGPGRHEFVPWHLGIVS
jgi:altronate hydrolase